MNKEFIMLSIILLICIQVNTKSLFRSLKDRNIKCGPFADLICNNNKCQCNSKLKVQNNDNKNIKKSNKTFFISFLQVGICPNGCYYIWDGHHFYCKCKK